MVADILTVNYVVVVLYSMIIDILLVARLSRTPGFGAEEAWIVRLLVSSIVCAVSDALCVGVGAGAGQLGNTLFNMGFILSTGAIGLLFFQFCAKRCDLEDINSWPWNIVKWLPFCLLIAMTLTTPWTGLVFGVTRAGEYVRGPLFWLFVFVLANGYTIAGVLISLVRYLCNKTAERRAVFVECATYIIPLIVGSFSQYFFTEIPASNMSITVTLLVIYMSNQQRLMQRRINEAEGANRAKSDFLGRMSHDIRTPINGIMGMIEIARDNVDDPEYVRSCLTKIDGAADTLLSIVNDVLDITKLESAGINLTEESFDIVELLSSISTLHQVLATEKGIELIDHGTDSIVHRKVVGSPKHVRSVLVNIAGNAIKYTNPGGRVSFFAREVFSDENRAVFEFTISDTGIGMSEEFAAHVFEPFSQERSDGRSTYQGTGLGLSIVKAIVDQMGGNIDLATRPGRGTTFVVTLPLLLDERAETERIIAADADVAKGSEQVEKPATVEGLRVLLVEDNDLNFEIAQYMLETSGALVTGARNGELAVEAFGKSEPGAFDVILMDVMMPVKDGLAATREIRALGRADAKDVPIIGMSANAFQDDVAATRNAGMTGYLVKPMDEEKLLEAISKYARP